ncbi:class I SAM-dependent methyltransferase [Aquincola sp. S2]|uniref:S-adenosyl-L-methionine-dependent methyltransferase n=1 Tax=Pseudaquabacterium terrae TaxID=2732868 RepID=A0ABX2EHL6_9BURK|nr:SAM-dependent methyltransferase [Aquabacterium terrae]NRF68119.1 class I SAM-dependent methyltransferase [Aquabacterium terrae]
MRADTPSSTALRAGMARARHQVLDQGRVFNDPLALRILGRETAERVMTEPENRVARALRAPLAARSRIAEDTIHEAVARGATQLVVLGAGLDTFAYRSPYPAPALRMFEVDHPATQAWKRGLLAEAGIAVPPALRYVPVDFETGDFMAGLRAAGFDPLQPAVFTWLGVTVYLTKDVVMATLRALREAGAPGSAVVFDYVSEPGRWQWHRRGVLALLKRRFARMGEPWRFFAREEALARELLAMGYRRVEDLRPNQILERLFAGHEADVPKRRSGAEFGGVMRLSM